MRKDWTHLEPFRIRRSPSGASEIGDDFGAFLILLPSGISLACIATSGDPTLNVVGEWEHVSTHARHPSLIIGGGAKIATPTWEEMHIVKTLFWEDEEAVAQFHPPRSEYVNNHPHVLHLWSHRTIPFLRPPKECV